MELQSAESLDEVKKAYKILVKVWHPDRFSHDPRLRKKAEDKIQQINSAYEELKCFFDEKCHKINAKSVAGEPLDTDVPWQLDKKVDKKADFTSAPKQEPPVAPTNRKAPPVTARSSSFGKYAFFSFLICMALFTVLVLYFLYRMDDSIKDLPQMAMETIQEKLKEFDAPAPQPHQKEKEPGKDIITVKPKRTDNEPSISAKAKTPCIIYLHSGDYIIAEAWWYNDDMLEYRVKHGIVGIEKKRVKDIRCE